MFCPKCGKENPEGAIFCQHCGGNLKADAKKACPSCGYENNPHAAFCEKCGLNIATPAKPSQPQHLPPPPPLFEYAGFWRRFLAQIIDGIILDIVFAPLYFLFVVPTGFSIAALNDPYATSADTLPAVALIGTCFCIFWIVSLVIVWLYYALMESSSIQGTLGKMAIGIIVTDLDGNRISFGRATGRFFGKYLSALILNIGYIMAGFTERKQALHDMLAGCLVVMKKSE